MNPGALLLGIFGCLLVVGESSGAVFYVNASGTTPVPPYTSWSTAATNIQDAVDVAGGGDEVLVANGIYQGTGRASFEGTTNRVVVNKTLFLHSANGAAATVIDGGGLMRCVFL